MEVDPWAVVLRRSRWYLLCWSHTRAARRVLRVDRIAAAHPLPGTFTPPAGLDALATLEEHLSQGWAYPVDVLIDASTREVARWLPRSFGMLVPTDDGRTRLHASTDNPSWYAGGLAVLPFAFRVDGSAQLQRAIADLGRRLIASASADSGTEPSAQLDKNLYLEERSRPTRSPQLRTNPSWRRNRSQYRSPTVSVLVGLVLACGHPKRKEG
jgi:hypothetical protein